MRFELISKMAMTLDVNPAELSTAQEKGVRIIKVGGKYIPTFYKKAGIARTEKMLTDALKKHRHKFWTLENDGDTAIELRVIYFFPHTSGTPKWKRDHVSFMTQRPDADNLSKSLLDCMTNLKFWSDDSMVYPFFSKYRSPHPCIRIQMFVWKQYRDEPGTITS